MINNLSTNFLKDFSCALHLRMHTSKPFRIQRLVDQMKICPDTAQNLIENRDNVIKVFLEFSYQIDWNDFSLYDLVINVDKLGLMQRQRGLLT